MTDFEHLSLIPGLLLVGHETTTSLLTMGLANLLHRGLWEEATRDDAAIAATVEELVRFESSITGMKRQATCPIEVGGRRVEKGDVIFAAYNGGSRDPKYYLDADTLKVGAQKSRNGQRPGKQHLGFGRAVHACLGAPLAHLTPRTELRLLAERLVEPRLITPFEEIKYEHVHESRGIEGLVIAWYGIRPREDFGSQATKPAAESATWGLARSTKVTVTAIDKVAQDIVQITLTPSIAADGLCPVLPSWQPGAHIDIPVGIHGFRQYSLCSSSGENLTWGISVLLKATGTGGSQYIHRSLRQGQTLDVVGPRNNFPFRPSARRYLFIAGGIGITPILPMI